MQIPEHGRGREAISKTMDEYCQQDLDRLSGRSWGYCYHANSEVKSIAEEAYIRFLGDNALDPTLFPSAQRFETELVAMCAAHLNGDEEVTGNFTSGGTESIMMAVKTARDFARARRPELRQPEMILPITAHAAFFKAGHFLDVKPVVVSVDPDTFAADPEAVRSAVTDNTILLVGSAPSYAHGVIDPIVELGAIALEADVPLHVDACIGFQAPFFAQLGADLPHCDFRVPGVTSISMDLHKYAYAPKGASVILYRSKALRKHQIFACAQWTGYSVINMTMPGSKSTGPMAAAWAVLNFIGQEGYRELTRPVARAAAVIKDAIQAHPDLQLLGDPRLSVLAFTCPNHNVFQLVDELNARGWYAMVQFASSVSPAGVHLTITPANAPSAEAFMADVDNALATIGERRSDAPDSLVASMSATLAQMDLSQVTDATVKQILAMAGIQGSRLPDRMADINTLLNAVPPALKESLLTVFFNEMYSQPHTEQP